jgi:hypothetical protein
MFLKRLFNSIANLISSGENNAPPTRPSTPMSYSTISSPTLGNDAISTNDDDPLDFNLKWGGGDKPITTCKTCGGHGSYGYGNPCPECGEV